MAYRARHKQGESTLEGNGRQALQNSRCLYPANILSCIPIQLSRTSNSYGDPAPLSSSFFGVMNMVKIHQAWQWLEFLWNFLAAVGDIPQYRKYYKYLTEGSLMIGG